MITDNQLIFIISQPRSGSTLLQALLSNNEHVKTTPEPWILLPYFSLIYPQNTNAEYNLHLALRGVNNYLGDIEDNSRLKKIVKKQILSIYSTICKKGNLNHGYLLDKTPRYYSICKYIPEIFPNARVICLKRNPVSVLNSIIDSYVKEPNMHRLNGRYHDFIDAPRDIQSFLNVEGNNSNVYELNYETLVLEPAETLRNIYNWLDIPFLDDVLNYQKNDQFKGALGDKKRASKSALPDPKSLQLWKYKLEEPYWASFFYGYMNFLGSEFLSKYGNYEYVSGSGKRFDEFMFINKYGLNESKCSYKAKVKYFLYRKTKLESLLK